MVPIVSLLFVLAPPTAEIRRLSKVVFTSPRNKDAVSPYVRGAAVRSSNAGRSPISSRGGNRDRTASGHLRELRQETSPRGRDGRAVTAGSLPSTASDLSHV